MSSNQDDDIFEDENSRADQMGIITKDAELEEDELVDKKLPKINLKHAIDMRDLVNSKGVLLDPEIEEDPNRNEHYNPNNVRDYFENEFKIDSDGEEEDSDEAEDKLAFEYRAKTMFNLTDDAGVKKKVKEPGLVSSGIVPDRGSVTVHYCLFLEGDDTPFDSTRLRGQPERFVLDAGVVLQGLEIAIKSMKKKEKSNFIISPSYAFGAMGCPPRVPQNAEVFARIELIDFVNESEMEALLMMPADLRNKHHKFNELEEIVSKHHLEGNAYCDQKEWRLAEKIFKRCSFLLEDVALKDKAEELRQQRQLKKMYLNLGQCYIKLGAPHKACISLQKLLALEPNNLKGNFRIGLAKRMLGNYSEARMFLERALRIEPTNSTVGRELALLDSKVRMDRENEAALCRKMFGGINTTTKLRTPSRNIKISDENYQILVEQFEAFKTNEGERELPMPPSMTPDELEAARIICEDLDLKLVEMERPKGQLKLVKK